MIPYQTIKKKEPKKKLLRIQMLFLLLLSAIKAILTTFIFSAAYLTMFVVRLLADAATRSQVADLFPDTSHERILAYVMMYTFVFIFLRFLFAFLVNWRIYKENLCYFFTLNNEKYQLRRKVKRWCEVGTDNKVFKGKLAAKINETEETRNV